MEQIQNDEISLKEMILKVREYVWEIWNNKTIVILVTVPILVLMMYFSMTTPTVYKTETRFIIEGQSGGLGGILGQFGLKGGSSTKANPYTTLEVAKSKELLKEVLFSKVPESKELIINTIINSYELDKKWAKKKPEFLGFRFKSDNLDGYTEAQRKAYISILGMLKGSEKSPEKALLTIDLDDESGIFTMNTKTTDEKLSLAIADFTYNRIKYFFEERALESLKSTKELLKFKVDSIQARISGRTFSAARFEDRNRNLISATKASEKSIMTRDITILTVALGEAIKSYEYADYAYRDAKPLFLKIDASLSPLEPVHVSKLMTILKALIIGGLLASIFILMRKIYRNAMQE